jgi:tetratricopeptide (TPR) repeat protein
MTKIKLGIVAAVLLMSNLVFAQSVQDGKKFLYYQRYNSAKETLEKVVAANPGDAEAQYWLGQVFIDMGQPEKAKDVYRKGLETAGSNPLLLVGMGHVELIEGKANEARQRFETAISLTKAKDVAVLNAVGHANTDMKYGDADYAIEKLILATQVKSMRDPDVYINLGDAYRKKNDGGGSVKAYQNALVMDPRYAEAKYRIGKIYLTQGKDQEDLFVKYFNEAIAIDPNYGPAYYDLYGYYFFRDVYKSTGFFNKYKTLADPGPALDYEEASLLFASGDNKGAIAKADQLLALQGENADARLYRLKSYSYDKLGDSLNAIQNMETFISKAKEEQIVSDNWLLAASLAAKFPEKQEKFDRYIKTAIAMDTSQKAKVEIARKAIDIFKRVPNQQKVAEWSIELLNMVKPAPSKVDIYNAGFESFKAQNYLVADSVFDIYKAKYPDEVYGYYWSFRSLSVVDSTMEQGLAVPDCQRFVEIAEVDKVKNKSTLITAYGYLAGYNANVKKDFPMAITYLDKIIEIDPANVDAVKNKEILQKALGKGASTKPAPKNGG